MEQEKSYAVYRLGTWGTAVIGRFKSFRAASLCADRARAVIEDEDKENAVIEIRTEVLEDGVYVPVKPQQGM